MSHVRLGRIGWVLVLLSGVVVTGPGAPSSQPQRGSTVVIAQGTRPNSLDALRITTPAGFTIATYLFDTLFQYVDGVGIVPSLVESTSVTNDGRVWTFRLRKGVKFHDGTLLDAAAVKFNLDRAADPATRSPYLTAPGLRIEVVDSATVRATTDRPHAPLLAELSHPTLGIQSPTIIQREGKAYGQKPSGTGPFKLETWVPGDLVRLLRNDAYRATPPFFGEVSFRAIPDQATRVAAVESGQVDIATDLSPAAVDRLTRGTAKIEIVKQPAYRSVAIVLNTSRPPFNDVRVRQAANYAVNKEAIVRDVLRGLGRVADAPLPQGTIGYRPVFRYGYDPAKAKSLIAQAGLPGGQVVELACPADIATHVTRVCEAVQADLRQVGLAVTIKGLEWSSYVEAINKRAEQLQMHWAGWRAATGDADFALRRVLHSSQVAPAGAARSFYKNERVDELLDRGRTLLDAKAREAAYAEAGTQIMRDAPWLFLYDEIQAIAVGPRVQGQISPARCPSCDSPPVAQPDCSKCACSESDCKRDCRKCNTG